MSTWWSFFDSLIANGTGVAEGSLAADRSDNGEDTKTGLAGDRLQNTLKLDLFRSVWR